MHVKNHDLFKRKLDDNPTTDDFQVGLGVIPNGTIQATVSAGNIPVVCHSKMC